MRRPLLSLFCVALLISSCWDSPKTIQKEDLVGAWIFETGTRNGGLEGVELLENLVFDFTDKTLTCELLPEMHEGFGKQMPYELKESTIIVAQKLSMPIKELSQDSLTVKLELLLGEEPTVFDLKFKRK